MRSYVLIALGQELVFSQRRNKMPDDIKELVNQFETWANEKIKFYEQVKGKPGSIRAIEYSAMIFSLINAKVNLHKFAGVK